MREEDEKLRQAVEHYGARWSKIAEVVGTRNGDQCWKRWYDCLDPRIDKSPWSAEEVCQCCPNATPESLLIKRHHRTQDSSTSSPNAAATGATLCTSTSPTAPPSPPRTGTASYGASKRGRAREHPPSDVHGPRQPSPQRPRAPAHTSASPPRHPERPCPPPSQSLHPRTGWR
jgi:hypothetical protein